MNFALVVLALIVLAICVLPVLGVLLVIWLAKPEGDSNDRDA
jgi:hypothetical protein